MQFFFIEKPFFFIQPVDVIVPVGRTATFECHVKGGKYPKIGWYYVSRLYNQEYPRNGVKVNKNNDLIISNAALSLPKTVVCFYEDSISPAKKYSVSVLLKVVGKIIIVCVFLFPFL